MNKTLISTLIVLVFANILVWQVIFIPKAIGTNFYFLNVGQGDSEMIKLSTQVEILIDGGPDNKVLNELAQVMNPNDKYIDLIILTHPHQDHFGGLIYVLKNYDVGLFAYNGETSTSQGFKELLKIIKEKNIQTVVLDDGDFITQGNNNFFILSPDGNLKGNKDLNISSMVIKFQNEDGKILLMSDVSKKVENVLIQKYNLSADILKVAHHGSKNSESDLFYETVQPKLSVFEVGKNSYGHPNNLVIDDLKNIGSKIYRTDQDGTVKITATNGKLEIYKLRK